MFGRPSRRKLLRDIAVLRTALLWYAARETWRRKGIHQKGAPRKKWQKSPAAFDRGHTALRALTLVDGGIPEPIAVPIHVTTPAPLVASSPATSTLGDSESITTDKD